ncbi:nitrile hydratase subunit beta [Amorphus orientalis]|uniref:Nitrile hydratase subunit beta n=1 Tax=Amorphus orientalis TaxID=649198 RepID=A0AAE3VM39_9HYPH|nr:nitrile hydratase subunit beta [Amorphus orientalis]MDQ0314467.1 nitrile hydratase [Amorphus orientalis]
MEGPQDLGGKMGFGPISPEPETEEPLFHAAWEPRVLGVTLCCGALGYWSLDGMRHARESLPPATYLSASYYQIWAYALENMLIANGELSEEELRLGRMRAPGRAQSKKLPAAKVPTVLRTGGPTLRETGAEPGFAVGDRVRTRNMHPDGHTRLPSYARDKTGTITARHGCHVLPDSNAHGRGEQPEWLYTVNFDGRTLWGDDGDPNVTVSIDAWESYLDHAE